jgi:hypothetical protein
MISDDMMKIKIDDDFDGDDDNNYDYLLSSKLP